MTRRPAEFRAAGAVHRADTCRPLEEAARAGRLNLQALARGSYPGRRMPRGLLPGVRSVGYWDAPGAQDWGLPEHRNEGIELTYLASGRIAFRAQGQSFHLRPGDLTVTRPWQPHQVGDPTVGPGRLYWIILDVGVRQPHQAWSWPPWLILDPHDRRELSDMLRQNMHPVWPGGHEVGRCFADIGDLLDQAGTPATRGSRLALFINELLLCVLEMLRKQDLVREPRLACAERAVDLFLAGLADRLDEPWTLDDMARAAGLKRTRFAHYCRKLTNRSPMDYLNALRVERAQALVRAQPQALLTHIAFECGFSSSQYFATVFRRHTGVSPGMYKNEMNRAEGEGRFVG